jgi:hypothetical protein
MKNIRRYIKNKKGINTILASLLMVVIVVVASVMVYAWSTGLLGTLLVQPNVGKEALGMDSYSFPNTTNVTIYVRNSGTVAVSFATYYIKDNSGNSWQLSNWAGPTGQPINPNSVLAVNVAMFITIGAGASGSGGQCGSSSCSLSGSGFTTMNSGFSYTIVVVTSRNNQFSFTVTR